MLSPSGQSDRADPRMSPTGGDEMSGAGGMTEAVAPKAESATAAPSRERAAAAARRRGSDAAIDMSALDAAAQSRVRFLRSRLSPSRAGNAPSRVLVLRRL